MIFVFLLVIYLILQMSYHPYYSPQHESEILGIEGQVPWMRSLLGPVKILGGTCSLHLLNRLGQLFDLFLKEG